MSRVDNALWTRVCRCRPRLGHAQSRREVSAPVTMVDRRVRVAIRSADGRLVQHCAGPAPDSRCPLAADEDVVACGGGTIVALRGTLADGRSLTVGSSVGPRCPLAGLIRHVPAPWD